MRCLFELRVIACLSLIAGLAASLFSQSLDTLLPFHENGKWGFINTQGNTVIPCQYESVLYWGLARYGKVKQNGEWHFITRKGQKLPLPLAGIPESFNDSILIIRSSCGKYLINESGEEILPHAFTDIKLLENGYFSYFLGDSCGLAHLSKGIITPAIFDEISFHGMEGFEVNVCNKTGFIDFNGNILVEPIYNTVGRNTNGLLQLSLGEAAKSGFYNTRNKHWLIQCSWDILLDSNQSFLVLEDERGSFIFNRKSGMFIPKAFHQTELIDEIAILESDSGKGVFDADRGFILMPRYSSINKEHRTYLAQENGAWKLFTSLGKPLSQDSFISILSLSAPAWVLERKDDWILLDSEGNTRFVNMHEPEVLGNKVKFFDGSTMISFMVDDRGYVVSKKSFDNVVRLQVNNYRFQTFESKLERLNNDSSEPTSLWFKDEKSKKWGLKHANGNILIAPVYDYVINDRTYNCTYVYLKTAEHTIKFAHSYYKTGARAGLVDKENGKLLVEPRYLDVFITGSTENPLFFGITEEFLFKRVLPQSKDVMPSYAWVDKSDKHPVRALASGSKPISTDNLTEMIYSKFEMIQRISNPEFNKSKAWNPQSNNRLTFNDQKWVYLFPDIVNSRQFYSEAEPFNNQLAIARNYRSKLYGLIDNRETVVLPFEYVKIRRSTKQGDTLYFLTRADTSLFLIDKNEEIISVEKQNDIWAYDGKYIFLRQPSSLGFTANEQKVNMFLEAWKMGKMSEGIIAVYANSGWKYYRENGALLNSKVYSKAYDFKEGKALVRERGKWRFLDNKGETSKALPWKNMKPLSGDGFMASDGRRWFITDQDGNALHENSYVRIKPLMDCEYVLVKEGSKWGLNSESGKALTKTKYNSIKYLGDDLFALQKGKRVYLKNGDTKERKLKRYSHFSKTSEGTFALRSKKGWHLADTSLNLLGEYVFRTIKPMHNSYSTGETNGSACLVDLAGEIAFSTKNRLIGDYSNGFILSYNKSKRMYCYLNNKGENMFAKDYLKAFPFENERAWVMTQSGWGCIDNSGEWIINPIYYDLKKMENEAYVAKTGAAYGLCDARGFILLNPIYNELEIKEHQLLFAQKGKDVVWKYLSGDIIYEKPMGKSLANNP